jgi:signal transduction histidine kinase
MVFALRDGRQASFPLMHGDRDLLIETVANLVDNAVKLAPRLIGSCPQPSPIRLARNSWASPSLSIAA